ncbi:FtsH protease activity modulator HflK [Sphingomonas glaciei]|uniref:Protein HflK n=1 Tax=Sphingomonas glaciei TaxID=2938948 RepID=A0ABY5MZD5_9SPHN|nr:FtsH protease activity modulator HflK [Sphingomonas glaciei]UUR07726.1 FtsH protease activity modulator HflK [Sphingomonas glaciei]
MNMTPGWAARARGLFADNKGPWGSSTGSTPPPGSGGPDNPGPASPWGTPGPNRPRGPGASVTSLDDFLARGRARFGGGRGGTTPPSKSMIGWGLLAVVLLWLVFTSFHRIAPEERGVVTQVGRYSRTLGPGIGFTLPSPLERVQKVDVENIRNVDLGSTSTETLMLTGDQNIIDIAYSVRWNVRDPELFLFEIQNPEETIQQVAESAMRAALSAVTLDQAIGEGRGQIENQVQENMQRILDSYKSGVLIQGVAVKQADPPAAVNDAFKAVSASQQAAQSDINQARAYALQLAQLSQGEATAFDKVYEQYRLAPEVTRRRMYYETMERVLQNVDKTIVEAPGVTPYLPLNQTRPPAAAIAEPGAQAPAAGAGR